MKTQKGYLINLNKIDVQNIKNVYEVPLTRVIRYIVKELSENIETKKEPENNEMNSVDAGNFKI